jgi:hypothetical protein
MRKTKNNRLHAKPSHAKNSYILVDLGFYFFTQAPRLHAYLRLHITDVRRSQQTHLRLLRSVRADRKGIKQSLPPYFNS